MKKLGRNDPCPCNSGKKYKQCCISIGRHTSNHTPVLPKVSDLIQSALEHFQAGRFMEAKIASHRALEIEPETSDVLHLLGLLANQEGHLEMAVDFISRAIQNNPTEPSLHNNLGTICEKLNGLPEAIACYRQAIKLKPDFAEAHYNLGNVFKNQGNFDEAVSLYQKAILLNPDYFQAYNNLGNVFKEKNKFEEAITCFKKVLHLNPAYAEAHNNMANALSSQTRLNEAVECLHKALSINPAFTEAHTGLIFMLDMMTDTDTQTLQEERKKWNKIHAAHLFQHHDHPNSPDPTRRLRIGYVSADLREHSAIKVFGAMLVKYDRAQFDVIVYSNTAREDTFTELFRQNATHWRRITETPDDAVADLIQQDRIDILVDLSGHSAGGRLLVFARKPAPIQITAWGYIGGTGMKAMDVFFADSVVVLPEEKPLYAEEVRYLPSVAGLYSPAAFPSITPLPALSTKQITFGSLNRIVKISDDAFRVWAKILLIVPDSKMILKTPELDNAGTCRRVLNHFMQAGVAPDRIILMGRTSWPDHVATFNQIDIALDPFPHGGGVTTLEGLMMGVPAITLRWPTIVGRLSASILTTLELTDWVAETPEEYIKIAKQKAQNLMVLAQLRQHLRPHLTSSVIGDADTYVEVVEQEYRNLWTEWCQKKCS